MIHRFFPFHALGLHANPFRALTDDEWARVAVLRPDVRSALDQIAHVQVLGAMGSGKTTTLLGLAAACRGRGLRVAYEYLPEGQRRFTTDPAHLDVFLLDEVQRLSWWQRWRLLRVARHGTRLILGSHADFRQPFARAKLPLITIRLDQILLDQLETILQRRIALAALNDPPSITFAPDAISYVWSTFGVRLRAMDHFLYEVFQRLDRPGMITAAQLQSIAAILRSTEAPNRR